jgi:hypothetical protein
MVKDSVLELVFDNILGCIFPDEGMYPGTVFRSLGCFFWPDIVLIPCNDFLMILRLVMTSIGIIIVLPSQG